MIARRSPEQVMFKREFSALTGKRLGALLRLTLLFTAMILALGGSLGGVRELQTRMKDPFTSSVEIPIPYVQPEFAQAIMDSFLLPAVRDSLKIDEAEFSQVTHEVFLNLADRAPRWFKVRTLKVSSRITDRILGPGDILLRQVRSFDPKDPGTQCGFIVTEKMVRDLGLDPATVEYVPMMIGDDAGTLLLMPVIAVVRSLPERTDLAVLESMALLLQGDLNQTGLVRLYDIDQELNVILSGDLDSAGFRQLLDSQGLGADVYHTSFQRQRFDHRKPIYQVRINTTRSLDHAGKAAWVARLRAGTPDQGVWLTFPLYCRDLAGQPGISLNKHRLHFLFHDLSRMSDFERRLGEVSDLTADLSKIESSKNFDIVARLTFGLSMGLFLFCLLGMVFSMNQLVENHLMRSRAGLGTLAAFGMSRRAFSTLYARVILAFVGLALLISLSFCTLVKGMLYILGKEHLLVLFDGRILLALVLGGLAVFISVRLAISRHLRYSPGDLVFNR